MNIYPRVLVVSNRDDFSTDLVCRQIEQKGVSYFRINSDDITHENFHYSLSETRVTVDGDCYVLNDVKSVYFRRAPSLFPKTHDPNEEQFVNRERRHFFEGMLTAIRAKWVNPMFQTYEAERKLLQLQVAKMLSFKIPNTLCTNSWMEARAFIQKNQHCIIKPISYGFIQKNDCSQSVFTSDITAAELAESTEPFESPILLQERIQKKVDLRVTIVGKSLFPVAIQTNGTNAPDWRQDSVKKRYEVTALPRQIQNKLVRLNNILGLIYSAVDLILDDHKVYYFLEINPVGEWAWLEKELDLPISDAIVCELTDGTG